MSKLLVTAGLTAGLALAATAIFAPASEAG